MATENEQLESTEMIEVFGELRPKNPLFIAIAEQAARNAASGLPDPTVFEPAPIEGEPLSHTILRDRGPY